MSDSISLFLILIAWLLAGCGTGASPPAAPTPARETITDYPALVQAFQAEGTAAQPGEEIADPVFTVRARILNLPGARVQVMEYPTEADAQAEAAKISPDGFRIGETMVVDWVAPPHFFRANRLIILYVGREEAMLDLLQRILGPQFAGAPPDQPTPTMVNAPTVAAHNPSVADLLRNPPAPGVSVEMDAYASGVGVPAYHTGPPPPPELQKCPLSQGNTLTDQPFPTRLVGISLNRFNSLSDDAPWLLAAGWHPFHGRLRGHLGDPGYAQCPQANRIFVIEQVVKVYQMDSPEVRTPVSPNANQRLPADYASWPVYHDQALGFTVRHPPDWRVEQTGPRLFVLTSPQFPRYPVTIRVLDGGAAFDPFAPPTRDLTKAPGFSVFEQQAQGSQHLHGYVFSLQDSIAEHSTTTSFGGIGRTYELKLVYPVGLNASQALLDAYTGMVEGFRLDNPPAATPTPPIKQTLGQGPFISRDEAWARARQINKPDLQLLDARLVSEAEARKTAESCLNMIPGHPEGIWLLTATYTFEGKRMLYLFIDATTGKQYCGEEFNPNATPYPAGQPSVTPTLVPTPKYTQTPISSPSPSAAIPSPSKPPTLIVWSRWSVMRPPPPEPKVNCLWHGADLLVWDHGRALILRSHPDSGYDILSGQLDQERMRQLIELIKTHGVYGTAVPPRPNPAGNYSDVGAKVDGDNYALNGDTLKLLTTWLAQDAAPYVPQRAWLTVEPYPVITSGYYKYQRPEELPVWPGERLGFALSQVPPSGRQIEGQAAAFVWHEVTSGRSIFTGFREGTDAFAVFISFQQFDPPLDSMYVPCRQNP